jgi:hypothetical protein
MPFESRLHLELPATTLNSQPDATTHLQVSSNREPVRDGIKLLPVYPHQVVTWLRSGPFGGLGSVHS